MDLRAHLRDHILLFDGAMGTCYQELSPNPQPLCELANLRDAKTVLDIHRRYVRAGCRALKTNTFAANRRALDCDAQTLRQVLTAGWRLAGEAAEDRCAVFADIGPIPRQSQEEQLTDAYREVLSVFLDLGARCFLFETFPDLDDLAPVLPWLRVQAPDCFILVSFAALPDGYTRSGAAAADLYASAAENPCTDAVGFNCGCGPKHMAQLISSLRLRPDKPLSVMPNAGYPTLVSSRTFFSESGAYFAKTVGDMVAAGAGIVGGCCGTTPQTIARLAEALAGVQPAAPRGAELEKTPRLSTRNLLEDKLRQGVRVAAVELDPPLDAGAEKFMAGVRVLQHSGADAITIADCPVSRARTDSSILACKVRRETGMDVVPHMTCRDRNRNATKALLLGLNMEDVRNVLAVTGDPIPSESRETVKGVFSMNAPKLAAFIRSLGPSLENGPFLVFGALNIGARNFDAHLKHARDKLDSGVSAFLTQPVLSELGFENLKRAHQELEGKLLCGIMPVVSHRNALYLQGEIAGIDVCDEICRLYQGKDRDACTELAVTISAEIARRTRDYCDGYYLITPFSRTDIISRILGILRAERLIGQEES